VSDQEKMEASNMPWVNISITLSLQALHSAKKLQSLKIGPTDAKISFE
jgi:hypothetical protein